MQVVYAKQQAPDSYARSIFLAGPTPRDQKTPSWRPEALRLLEEKGYDGVVFVPEDAEGKNFRLTGEDQILWEHQMLDRADCIVFWVPRDLASMPALTTNVEFGHWVKSGKAVFGAPPEAPKNTYLRHMCDKHKAPRKETLSETLDLAVAMVSAGGMRYGTETAVPLMVWNTGTFQAWYRALKQAGNKLLDAKVEWTMGVEPGQPPFFWILKAKVFIAAEDRVKENEVVVSRPDTFHVLLFSWNSYCPGQSKLVLIREFRSPGASGDGYVWSIPGGSAEPGETDPSLSALRELEEEVGFRLTPERIRRDCGTRQFCATLSAHKGFLLAAAVSDAEISELQKRCAAPKGNAHETERTFVEIVTLDEVLKKDLLDWSSLGMIYKALHLARNC